MISENVYSISDVVDQLQITPGRVRQICREFGIGQLVGNTRILTAADIEKIRSRPDRRKSEESAYS